MLRDKLLARLAEAGAAPDYQALAAEVLGIRGAPAELARRLVSQALVLEDRRDAWRKAGHRIASRAPETPAVYVLRDDRQLAVYVGKAVNLRRRLRAHFSERRWRRLPPAMATVVDAEWREVGSELEALLREAALIAELAPVANVQTSAPVLETRAVPRTLLRDVIVLAPSIEDDSVELVCARPSGEWMIQRTRRSGVDLRVHTTRVMRFFGAATRRRFDARPLGAIVYSWLAGRGCSATRLDPHDTASRAALSARLLALFRDDRLFHERLDQRGA